MKYSYQQEFKQALKRTKRLGFNFPEWTFKNELILSNDTIKTFNSTLMNFLEFQNMSFEDLSAQCISVHTVTAQTITRTIKCDAIVTIGWFYDTRIESAIYKFTEEDFKVWMSQDLQAFPRSDVHVWITLDSGEIVDFTLMTTLGKVMKISDGIFKPGTILVARPEEPECFIKYHPMVVGRDAIFAAKLLRYVDFI